MDLEDFRAYELERLTKDGKNHAVLFFEGSKAREALKIIYDLISREQKTTWIENPLSQRDFWNKILKGANYDSKQNLKDLNAHRLFRRLNAHLIDGGENHYLFIPNIERIFYKFPWFNSRLRAISQEPRSLLNIYASVLEEGSIEYEKTLGNYNFPFYIGNFQQIEC